MDVWWNNHFLYKDLGYQACVLLFFLPHDFLVKIVINFFCTRLCLICEGSNTSNWDNVSCPLWTMLSILMIDIIAFKLIKSIISSLMDTKIRIRQKKNTLASCSPNSMAPVALIMLCAASAPALRCFRTSAWQKGFRSQPKNPLRSCLKNNPPSKSSMRIEIAFWGKSSKIQDFSWGSYWVNLERRGKDAPRFFWGDFYGLGSLFFPKIHRTVTKTCELHPFLFDVSQRAEIVYPARN